MASPAFALARLRSNPVLGGFETGAVAVGAWLPVVAGAVVAGAVAVGAVAVGAVAGGVVSVEFLF